MHHPETLEAALWPGHRNFIYLAPAIPGKRVSQTFFPIYNEGVNETASPRSLATHILAGFTAVILLTALAIGIPAIWLVRNQLEMRTFAQVVQGIRAAEALVDARQAEIQGLALLTSQRPTLQAMLENPQTGELDAYLDQLRRGAGVNALVVCSPASSPAGSAGTQTPGQFCPPPEQAGIYTLAGENDPRAWALAPAEIGAGYQVVVGARLDDSFARQVQEQLGVEYGLWANGAQLASSFPEKVAYIPQPVPGHEEWMMFTRAGKDYYGIQTTVRGSQVVAEVALDVSQINAAQNQFLWVLVASILLVSGVGWALGLFLARRISRPLQALAEAANQVPALHQPQPLQVESNIREVTQLTEALNRASQDLRSTLQRLQREKDWGKGLLEAIVEGIVTLDTQGRVTFFSHGAEQITGWESSAVLGQPAGQVFRSPEIEALLDGRLPLPGKAHKMLVELPSGEAVTLSVTRSGLVPAEAGEGEIALVFRDITQEELMHRLLGQFLANIAHEFRTPLSALEASTELLLDQAADLSPEELHTLLTSLHVSVINLQTLIDNLLESASIEAGRFHVSPRPVELQALVSEAARIMAPLLEKYGQDLVSELPREPLWVMADPRRTIQVLVNLLANASKYGPREAGITLSAALAGGFARVEVADRGAGIPLDQQQLIFERFAYPGEGQEQAKVGVGLGLSVVKSIVEAHGGQVGVQSDPGGGARFWFTLPVESAA
jgi:PAS domain S-box-containing protein